MRNPCHPGRNASQDIGVVQERLHNGGATGLQCRTQPPKHQRQIPLAEFVATDRNTKFFQFVGQFASMSQAVNMRSPPITIQPPDDLNQREFCATAIEIGDAKGDANWFRHFGSGLSCGPLSWRCVIPNIPCDTGRWSCAAEHLTGKRQTRDNGP